MCLVIALHPETIRLMRSGNNRFDGTPGRYRSHTLPHNYPVIPESGDLQGLWIIFVFRSSSRSKSVLLCLRKYIRDDRVAAGASILSASRYAIGPGPWDAITPDLPHDPGS